MAAQSWWLDWEGRAKKALFPGLVPQGPSTWPPGASMVASGSWMSYLAAGV